MNHWKLGKALLYFMCSLYLISCSVNDSADDFNTWTFSGHVVDGSTGKPLSDVEIYYRKEDKSEATFTTGTAGDFVINNIPFGQKTFQFTYVPPMPLDSADSANFNLNNYTEQILIVSPMTGLNSTDGEVGDASQVVNLYPLTGSYKGMIKIRNEETQVTEAAKNILIRLNYNGTDMTQSFPKMFETTTDSNGMFLFKNLPLTSDITLTVSDVLIDQVQYSIDDVTVGQLSMNNIIDQGTLLMTVNDTTHLAINDIASNVISADGFGLSGIQVSTTPWYIFPASTDVSTLNAKIEGVELQTRTNGDTLFVDPIKNLAYNTAYTVTITGKDTSDNLISFVFDGVKQFTTVEGVFITESNIWNDAKNPLQNVPVNTDPYLVLSSAPEESSLQVSLMDGDESTLDALLDVSGDTIFIRPIIDFKFDTEISITLSGADTTGRSINITLEGEQAFRTEKNIFPILSNTWDNSGAPVNNFDLFDTMWVVFSEPLNTDLGYLIWSASDAENSIIGDGNEKNSEVWISGDTLFVLPDPRISINFGETIGFKVSVLSTSNKRSDDLEFSVRFLESSYQVKWSNTKDQFGNTRDDFKMNDSIVIVSSQPIDEVTAITELSGSTPPSDLTLDNIRVSGDTIIYTPSILFDADTEYGMAFDITFANNISKKGVLPVTWKTKQGVRILSTNNREGGPFQSI